VNVAVRQLKSAGMSTRQHYLCEFRLDGQCAYFLWYGGDVDGVILDGGGRLAAFATAGAAMAFASAHRLALSPAVTACYDLDLVARWCRQPQAEGVNCDLFLNAWNLFTDMCASRAGTGGLFQHVSKKESIAYDKLFFGNNLPAVTPPGARYEPAWSADELLGLSQVLGLGLQEFRRAVNISIA
jgi:hypothetical protein